MLSKIEGRVGRADGGRIQDVEGGRNVAIWYMAICRNAKRK